MDFHINAICHAPLTITLLNLNPLKTALFDKVDDICKGATFGGDGRRPMYLVENPLREDRRAADSGVSVVNKGVLNGDRLAFPISSTLLFFCQDIELCRGR